MSQPKQIGKTFAFIFWGILLVLLYQFFAAKLEADFNPNQQPESYYAGDERVLVLKRNRFGHYVSNGHINGYQVVFLLDTGATHVAVPLDVANRIGLPQGNPIRVNTANGVATAYTTSIDQLKIGKITLDNVKASIVPGMQGEQILLGMSVLKHVEFSQRGDELTITQTRE